MFWRQGYYRAAKCHLAMGSIKSTTMYLQKVLQKDPENKDAQNDVSLIFNKLLLLVFCLFLFFSF